MLYCTLKERQAKKFLNDDQYNILLNGGTFIDNGIIYGMETLLNENI